MSQAEPIHQQNDEVLDFSAALGWLQRRWYYIAAGATMGMLIAGAIYFAQSPRFTARVDFTIVESPVGSPAFVQQVSRSFLERHLGEAANVSLVVPTGTFSVASRDLAPSEVQDRLGQLQDGVAALSAFLNAQAVARYEIVKQDVIDFPENEIAYNLLTHFRTYVNAQESGIFEQIRIQNESASRQGLPWVNMIALGFVIGGGAGLLVALAANALARRNKGRV